MIQAKRNHLHVSCRSSPGSGMIVDTRAEPANCLQASLHTRDLQQSCQATSRAVDERRQPFGIDLAHASNMTTKVSAQNEVSKNSLIQERGMTVRD